MLNGFITTSPFGQGGEMEEKDKQDKQDRERLLKRFKDRKPLDDNADSDIMAPPDVREAMSSRRYETANIIEQGIYDLIEVSELHSGALKLADKIIALDKPTGVVRVDKAGKETELTQEELCEWARWLIKNGMPYRSPTGDVIPWQVGWSKLRVKP
jgi:hypothetical protein